MSTYHAPLPDMLFVLNDVAGLSQVASLPGFEDATAGLGGEELHQPAALRDI